VDGRGGPTCGSLSAIMSDRIENGLCNGYGPWPDI
jgi:hypothetical protein